MICADCAYASEVTTLTIEAWAQSKKNKRVEINNQIHSKATKS